MIMSGIAVKVMKINEITAKITRINWGLLSENLRLLNFNENNGISETSSKLMPIAMIARM
jgi:hypothetical protein